jgi:hypothetical protein
VDVPDRRDRLCAAGRHGLRPSQRGQSGHAAPARHSSRNRAAIRSTWAAST